MFWRQAYGWVRRERGVGPTGGSAIDMNEDPLVCVVDDEEGIRSLIGDVLESEGHRVETFHDGESFLAFRADERPDLVFLDINMPGLSGWEVQRRLAEDPDCDATVVAVTARGGESVRTSAGEGPGFDGYLRKPFDLDTLLDTARSLTDRTSAQT